MKQCVIVFLAWIVVGCSGTFDEDESISELAGRERPTPSVAAMAHVDAARVGHDIEDIDYVGSGPLRGSAVILDGYDVYAAKLEGSGCGGPPEKLFDLKKSGVSWGPRGIAWVPPLGRFVVIDPRQQTKLFGVDHRGRTKPALTIKYLDGFVPYHLEALAYVPPTASKYPNTIAMIAIAESPGVGTRIEILDLTGQVIEEIVPAEPIGSGFTASLSYASGDRFLVSQGNGIFTLDLDGNVLSGPVAVEGTWDVEGISQTPSGSILMADYEDGILRFFDANLTPLPEQRSYTVGIGASFPLGLAWDPGAERFLMQHLSTDGPRLVSIERDLSALTPIVTLEWDTTVQSNLAFIPDEGLTAAVRQSTGHVWLHDASGVLVQDLDLSAYSPISAFDYDASEDQFVLSTTKPGEETTLHFIQRDGTDAGSLDLGNSQIEQIFALAVYEVRGERRFLVADSPLRTKRLVAFGEDGKAYWKKAYQAELGVVQPSDMATLRHGSRPMFAITDSGSSEVFVFKAP